jgi:hypothetical protein
MSAKQRSCGNCKHFVRIQDFSKTRNGICGKHDYNCHSDSRYARRCPSYQGEKYSRKTKNPEKAETL